jgi:GNAT superfamily N-acetyltransferase
VHIQKFYSTLPGGILGGKPHTSAEQYIQKRVDEKDHLFHQIHDALREAHLRPAMPSKLPRNLTLPPHMHKLSAASFDETRFGDRPQVFNDAILRNLKLPEGYEVSKSKAGRLLHFVGPVAHSLRLKHTGTGQDPSQWNLLNGRNVQVDVHGSKKRGREIYFAGMHLRPEHQRKGLGTAYLHALRHAAGDLDIPHVGLLADDAGRYAWSHHPDAQFDDDAESEHMHNTYGHWRKNHPEHPELPKGSPPRAYPKEFLLSDDVVLPSLKFPALKMPAKTAAAPHELPRERQRALRRVDRLMTAEHPGKWDELFMKHVHHKYYVDAIHNDPRASDSLKRHADQMHQVLNGKVVHIVKGDSGTDHSIVEKKDGGLGCTCRDWRFKRSLAPAGEQDCKHIKEYKRRVRLLGQSKEAAYAPHKDALALLGAGATLATGAVGLYDAIKATGIRKDERRMEDVLKGLAPGLQVVDTAEYLKKVDPSIMPVTTPADVAELRRRETWVTDVDAMEILDAIKRFDNAFTLSTRNGGYIVGAPKLPALILDHEVGHVHDYRARGPRSHSGWDELLQSVWKPSYERATMAGEREAWRLAEEYLKTQRETGMTDEEKAVRDAALNTYDKGFHYVRAGYAPGVAMTTGALTAGKVLYSAVKELASKA